MNPHQLFRLVGPANNFAMNGLPMHMARILLVDGHSLLKQLFLDVLIEKTQLLVEFVRTQHVGLCLTANINGNSAIIPVYDNFSTGDTLLLQVTVSNLPNLESQLFQLYTEIQGTVQQFLPEEDDLMPLLKDTTDEGSYDEI